MMSLHTLFGNFIYRPSASLRTIQGADDKDNDNTNGNPVTRDWFYVVARQEGPINSCCAQFMVLIPVLIYFQDMCKSLVTVVSVLVLLLVPITEVQSSNSSELTELHIGGIFPINGKGGWWVRFVWEEWNGKTLLFNYLCLQARRNRVYAGCEISSGGCELEQGLIAGIQVEFAQQRQRGERMIGVIFESP